MHVPYLVEGRRLAVLEVERTVEEDLEVWVSLYCPVGGYDCEGEMRSADYSLSC